ncbi:L-threonylcarbamoyladenylate synthase [uncultured Anaerococcus sp.]|uniref:L-threonylcarbamoyladenylate synthase n=1 Tax=uncultured Anaerococcus sp. TaxID=293428 RepID=UPI00260F001D|nr:L-threonylcarbamoyladenylate synthase [uncultured Anaerococcus sp.]
MQTEVLRVDRNNIDQKIIKKAADLLKKGELVAFPTETVYGLGASGLNDESCKNIFKTKNRPIDNPLILHISNIDMLYNLVEEVSEDAKKLFGLWPGPLTIIFKKSKLIPTTVTAGGDTVAIRFPVDEIARNIIEEAKIPIAAPSANISGRPSPTNASDCFFDLDGKIPLIVDGGESRIGIESTVIDLSEDIPTILRPGFYTLEMLREILPQVRLDDALVDDNVVPKSPGQKYKHYAPKARMQVYVGDRAADFIYKKARSYRSQGIRVGVLIFDDDMERFDDFYKISFGDRNDLRQMSHKLFAALRQMDKMGVDLILAEGVMDNNLGKSIMNRMKKSAAGNIEYL